MKRSLLVIVLLGIFACWTMSSFAQNSDPRMWSIHFPRTGEFYDVPPGNLTWQNPNHKTMEYIFRDQIVDVLPNFRVHPSNAWQSEVPITRGLDPNILFASANVFFSSSYFFSEGVYVSTDGGNNWFGHDTCTASPISDHGGDPGPGVGPDGRLYMSYLPGSYNSIKAAYSTNLGNTWSAGAILQSGSQDKNLTAVDNVPGSPYSGRVYVVWSDFTQSQPAATVSYSSNGGVNWSTYQHINTSASGHYCQGVNPAVGPGGVVYVAWQSPVSGFPYTGQFVGIGKSTDGGATWTYNNNIYNCNGIRGELSFTGGFGAIRVNDFPWLAIDNSGGPRNGWMYIVTAEKGLAPAGNDADVVMHVSSDGGTTWSAGIRVNQDALNNGQYQYMPAACVGEDGAVNVVYYDTRNATISGGLPDSAEVYVSRSTDGGTTFEDIKVSDHSFKPKPISGLAGGYQGDYIGIVESNGTVYPYWCDNVTGIYQAWTTQVTFAPPCPVEVASNPNPPSGSTNVDINLSQLTWSNGADANSNELYFGTNPTALDLVQSGSLATSWNIDPGYLPLSYYTTYYWKVVEIGDTCSSGITFSFKTMQDPNFVMVTDTLYPQNAQYWTGTTNGSSKTDGEINTVDPNVGWAVFDISSIPDIATITGVSLYGYINAISYPYWSVTPMGNVNPITDNAGTINAQIQNNYGSNDAYFYFDGQMTETGWWNSSLGNSAQSDLQNSLTQNWFAVGFIDWDFDSQWYINFDGWTQPNPPYIIVDYNYIVPVELTSFTASAANGNVSLSWQTATEINNKGFEIERQVNSPQSSVGKWEEIGYVTGSGTTTESRSYSFNDNNVKSGNYIYRLKQIDLNGSSNYSNEVEVSIVAPTEFSLEQNYPNPFNPATLIKYSIPADQQVKLNVYNLLGQKVMTLVNDFRKAGQYEINFNASRLASGVYFYKLEAGNQSSIKKMILMK
ncbi:MAG TPA: T9SS type A sorting domain-containing protein [Ignavibacteriaceae bacterium]|nr:T9SS type A sorting domain-containing protein [Ignavibacteriaceae bacterium]